MEQTPQGRGATAAQLQNDIDSGRTGDKAAGFDPAAAPLGTDDEAAGAPNSPALIAEARAQEAASHEVNPTRNAVSPEFTPDARASSRPTHLTPILLGSGAALALGLLMLAFR